MAVGFVVGGWLASTVISKLIDYAKDQKIQLGLKDELVARLENGLPNIQELVKTIDQGLIREENPDLEQWLWQLRDAADQADDVMDEIKYNYEKEKVEAEKNSAVNEDPFLKRLKKAVKAIDMVAKDVGLFSVLVDNFVVHQRKKVKLAISSRETTSFLNLQNHVFGRQEEKKDIIKKLLNPHCKTKRENLTVLPIIGVGGVGKTTLVQLVYNDPIVEKHFELRLWVCISNNFDVVLITKKLYESTFGETTNFDSFDSMQKKLKEKLESKRILIVFDDVWNDNNKQDWEKVIAPLQNGKNGSMMLLTTRMKAVATLTAPNILDSIILEGLNEYDMWDFFKECAFGGEDPNYHKGLLEIGRTIVKKLEGIPLAAKTVGGILYSNLDEDYWIDILESELWSLKQGQNDIMPALRLTYQYLPPHLKPCFSFCSIFSQDHLFSKNDLIQMWIASGMVPRSINGTMRPEDVGSKYFDEMLSKSIFTRPNHRSSNENDFVMHDLIHDLSVLVSQGECLRTTTKKSVNVPHTIRHLYAHIDGPCELSIFDLKNLRTLILDIDESLHSDHDSLVAKILDRMESLRLLVLFTHNLSEFPESADKLLHIRYLSLNSSRISAFPNVVSKLYLLETMVYKDFRNNKLRKDDGFAIGMLVNLRHLITPSWVNRIVGIGRLTSLQELDFGVLKDSAFKISELSDMRELRDLTISSIENVGSHEEVIQANLKDKVNLQTLTLIWDQHRNQNKHANEGVLDHLQPHSGLKELSIRSYEGTGKPPTWFRTQTLLNLVHLKIWYCNFEHIPCLHELPLLKNINFREMNAIESIIHECNMPSIDAFPSLEQLYIRRMRAIKEWCLEKQPNKWMHCLRKLKITNCPELQVLPPIPVGIKELSFIDLGINALPNIWNNQSSKSGSLSDLVVMSISNCENLVSLTEGLLQNPERFVAIEELYITNCSKLVNFPLGGFNKFISLKILEISDCPQIDGRLVSECFLPSALQKLSISSCGGLETTLPKALKGVHSLIELELRGFLKLTSLPPKEVFNRWKTLKILTLEDCIVLTSLESLLGLSCIEHLEVRGCPQLSQAIPFPFPLKKYETERMEEGRSISAQPQPLFSVDKLVIDDPFLLSVEPFRSLSAVKVLIIEDCSELQFLPELPPVLEELKLRRASPELKMRCKKSGSDWPKLSQIPQVFLGFDALFSMTDSDEDDNAGYLMDIDHE